MKHAIPQRACPAVLTRQAESGEPLLRTVRLGLILMLLLSLSLLWAPRPLLAQEGEPAPTEEGAPPEEASPAEDPRRTIR